MCADEQCAVRDLRQIRLSAEHIELLPARPGLATIRRTILEDAFRQCSVFPLNTNQQQLISVQADKARLIVPSATPIRDPFRAQEDLW